MLGVVAGTEAAERNIAAETTILHPCSTESHESGNRVREFVESADVRSGFVSLRFRVFVAPASFWFPVSGSWFLVRQF